MLNNLNLENNTKQNDSFNPSKYKLVLIITKINFFYEQREKKERERKEGALIGNDKLL